MARHSKEFLAFTATVDKLLSVPRAELQRRLDAYKEQADKNPNKRGPKRKAVTPSADEPRDDASAS